MVNILDLFFNPALISLGLGLLLGNFTPKKLPTYFMDLVTLYLVFAIGFKGGSCLGGANLCTPPLIILTLVGITIGFIQPFIHWHILKKTTRLDTQTRTVVAAEYGSISIVTFITALSFLNNQSIMYDTFMTAFAALMEVPALISGLLLLQGNTNSGKRVNPFMLIYEILACKKISFIFLGYAVGYVSRFYDTTLLDNTIIFPFTLMLIIFMIDIGMKIADQLHHLELVTRSLVAFGLYVPLINGLIACIIGSFIVDLPGTLLLFSILIASASYIAVPALMQSQAPKAKEAIYLPLSLAITLPFNIVVGIPLFYFLSSMLLNH